jgi:hypothetical protein
VAHGRTGQKVGAGQDPQHQVKISVHFAQIKFCETQKETSSQTRRRQESQEQEQQQPELIKARQKFCNNVLEMRRRNVQDQNFESCINHRNVNILMFRIFDFCDLIVNTIFAQIY